MSVHLILHLLMHQQICVYDTEIERLSRKYTVCVCASTLVQLSTEQSSSTCLLLFAFGLKDERTGMPTALLLVKTSPIQRGTAVYVWLHTYRVQSLKLFS